METPVTGVLALLWSRMSAQVEREGERERERDRETERQRECSVESEEEIKTESDRKRGVGELACNPRSSKAI